MFVLYRTVYSHHSKLAAGSTWVHAMTRSRYSLAIQIFRRFEIHIRRYLNVVCTDRRRAQRKGRFGWSFAAILEAPHRQRHKYSAQLPMLRSIWLYAVPCAYTRTRVSRSFDPRILLLRPEASLSLSVPPSQIHAISSTRSSSSSSVAPHFEGARSSLNVKTIAILSPSFN